MSAIVLTPARAARLLGAEVSVDRGDNVFVGTFVALAEGEGFKLHTGRRGKPVRFALGDTVSEIVRLDGKRVR